MIDDMNMGCEYDNTCPKNYHNCCPIISVLHMSLKMTNLFIHFSDV